MINLESEAYQLGQVLLIDKPLTWSSFQAVKKIKYWLKTEHGFKKIKVGHAGTLDPLATGLLIVCTGKRTKTISEIQGQQKEYTGTIQLGGNTPSYDLETEVTETFDTSKLTDADVHDFAKAYIGTIQQRPPIFSALKKDGKRLYELARAGETTEIPTRPVTIHSFEITNISPDWAVDFKVQCSKGTYIRSLAFDMGEALKCGGHLTSLRRTMIGDYHVDNALKMTDFDKSE